VNVLYEEEGEFKVGAVLAQAPASLQVESPHGKRSKVKSAQVLLSFERPSGMELLNEAGKYAAAIDTDFLWQCCGAGEFGFQELAREYVGRAPAPAEAAGVLLKLHSAPMYFYRRGRGRYQAAPEDTLKRALEGLEKKKRIQEKIADWATRLARFECPPEIAALQAELLYAPDRGKPEWKALEQACRETRLASARLFERCGRLADSHAYHLGRFLHEFFPRGTSFPPHPVPQLGAALPRAGVQAFSLDDVGTTEIDDAFSVTRVSAEELCIGVHIAAPALGIAPGSPLDAIARERLLTAYLPGEKFTMLPEDVIEAFSLDHGNHQPAVSLYLTVSTSDFAVRGRQTRLEQVEIAANLRHARYDCLNALFESGGAAGLAFEEELRELWRFSCALEKRRGKPAVPAGQPDYLFRVEEGCVRIEPRKRGAPLDKLVAELMILANSAWGEFLAERDLAAIYRVQSSGKVRLSVHPEEHEGLGVACYAWTSSPLRRYVDLLNQWQLLAALGGAKPPFGRSSEALLAAMRAFELTHARYDDCQRAMESYWCLRWLLQERVAEIRATVVRENVVRLEGLPLTTRVASLPALAPGTRVAVSVEEVDLIECRLACAYRGSIAAQDAQGAP
jgi:exoribonuclease-2